MAEELNLVIQSPEQGKFLKRIEWNRKALMDFITQVTERYQGVVFTEDQIREAKRERAQLNAMRKAISDRRIQVKNEIMEPYNIFEREVGEVVSLIDKPIKEIDAQIKGFEERQKNEKRDALERYFEEIGDGLNGCVSFERVFDKRYLNVSVSLSSAKKDIKAKVAEILGCLGKIGEVDSEYRVIVKDAYLRTLDMGAAYGEMYRLMEMKRREEAVERQSALEREKADADMEAEAKGQPTLGQCNDDEAASTPEGKEEEMAQATIAQLQPNQQPLNPPKQYKASFTVYGTKEEIMSVKQFMINHNIRFGKVEQ